MLFRSDRGGIEADVTLVHDGPGHFYLITGSAFGVHDAGWVARNLPDGVTIREVTNGLATLNIVGPSSRAVLEAASDDDVSNAALPFLGVRAIDIGQARVMAVRIGYVVAGDQTVRYTRQS